MAGPADAEFDTALVSLKSAMDMSTFRASLQIVTSQSNFSWVDNLIFHISMTRVNASSSRGAVRIKTAILLREPRLL